MFCEAGHGAFGFPGWPAGLRSQNVSFFITFCCTQHWGGHSFGFPGQVNARYSPSLCAVSSMHLPIAFNAQEVIHLKGSMASAFLLLPPGWATCGDLSFRIHSAPSTDFQALDKILCESDLFNEIEKLKKKERKKQRCIKCEMNQQANESKHVKMALSHNWWSELVQFWKAGLNNPKELTEQYTINTSGIIFLIIVQLLVMQTRNPWSF